jgi:hypothetical protein
MGKRLLFALLFLPFSVAISLMFVGSLFFWIIRGKGLIDEITYLSNKMRELL